MPPVSLTPTFSTGSNAAADLLPSASMSDTPLITHLGWQHVAGAALAALSVGTLALTTLGFLVVVVLGLGLSRAGAPSLIVWPVVSVAGLVAIALSCRLGLRVWRFELAMPVVSTHPPLTDG